MSFSGLLRGHYNLPTLFLKGINTPASVVIDIVINIINYYFKPIVTLNSWHEGRTTPSYSRGYWFVFIIIIINVDYFWWIVFSLSGVWGLRKDYGIFGFGHFTTFHKMVSLDLLNGVMEQQCLMENLSFCRFGYWRPGKFWDILLDRISLVNWDGKI